jgi:hypothetical protein
MQAKYISYQQTHAFSSVVLDYIDGKDTLESFYKYSPNLKGFESAVADRKFSGSRSLLVSTLHRQYSSIEVPALTTAQILIS